MKIPKLGKYLEKIANPLEPGAETSKACLELAIGLGLLGSPLAIPGIAVAGLSFVGLAAKGIKHYSEKNQDKLSLEECVAIASTFAYVESFERILALSYLVG